MSDLAICVEQARDAFMRVLVEQPQWRCAHCGHDIDPPQCPAAREIWEQADPDGRFTGTVRSIAVFKLLKEQMIAVDDPWRVSLPSRQELCS